MSANVVVTNFKMLAWYLAEDRGRCQNSDLDNQSGKIQILHTYGRHTHYCDSNSNTQ